MCKSDRGSMWLWVALGTMLLLTIVSFILWWFRIKPFDGSMTKKTTTMSAYPQHYNTTTIYSNPNQYRYPTTTARTMTRTTSLNNIPMQPKPGSVIYFSKHIDPNHYDATFSGVERVEGINYVSNITGDTWVFNKYYGRYVKKIDSNSNNNFF